MTLCLCLQDGVAALHMAAQEGKGDVIKLLTEAKAQVNIQAEVCMSSQILFYIHRSINK